MTDAFLTRPQAITRISRGDTLYMEHREGERCWWFDGPYEEVGDDVIQEIAFKPGRVCELVEHGDSLFGEVNSQSWKGRIVEKVKERPISFGAPMILAILDDRKWQTRRILKPQFPDCVKHAGFTVFTPKRFVSGRGTYIDDEGVNHGPAEKFVKLSYAFGDRLWVREAWRTEPRFDHLPPRDVPVGSPLLFECDDPERNNSLGLWGRYRHARFMPRWASRIILDVTAVKVERLCDIHEDDAAAEGVRPIPGQPDPPGAHRVAFRDLWQTIHGAGAWEKNPWVVAVTFVRVPS